MRNYADSLNILEIGHVKMEEMITEIPRPTGMLPVILTWPGEFSRWLLPVWEQPGQVSHSPGICSSSSECHGDAVGSGFVTLCFIMVFSRMWASNSYLLG